MRADFTAGLRYEPDQLSFEPDHLVAYKPDLSSRCFSFQQHTLLPFLLLVLRALSFHGRLFTIAAEHHNQSGMLALQRPQPDPKSQFTGYVRLSRHFQLATLPSLARSQYSAQAIAQCSLVSAQIYYVSGQDVAQRQLRVLREALRGSPVLEIFNSIALLAGGRLSIHHTADIHKLVFDFIHLQ